MNLSLITGDAKPYLEYGWVCAPNTAGQSITANTLTTLTIDTEIADTGNYGSIASNQITLAAGTYYFEASCPIVQPANGSVNILSLYNNTAAAYVTRESWNSSNYQTPLRGNPLKGQFTISTASVFTLLIVVAQSSSVISQANGLAFTLATAGADQRTTIKLWKLA